MTTHPEYLVIDSDGDSFRFTEREDAVQFIGFFSGSEDTSGWEIIPALLGPLMRGPSELMRFFYENTISFSQFGELTDEVKSRLEYYQLCMLAAGDYEYWREHLDLLWSKVAALSDRLPKERPSTLPVDLLQELGLEGAEEVSSYHAADLWMDDIYRGFLLLEWHSMGELEDIDKEWEPEIEALYNKYERQAA